MAPTFGRNSVVADHENPQTLEPTALTAADVARILGVPVEAVEKDIAEGAPAVTDGTMNVVHYAAWLLRTMADGSWENESDGNNQPAVRVMAGDVRGESG
jgi:hypothetical protein